MGLITKITVNTCKCADADDGVSYDYIFKARKNSQASNIPPSKRLTQRVMCLRMSNVQ